VTIQLFFVDNTATADNGEAGRLDDPPDEIRPSLQEDEHEEHPETSLIPQASGSKPPKRSVWSDPDDNTLQVSLADTKRARKLRDDATEDVVSGSRYESKLRREFERIQPVPEWASKAKSKAKAKRRRSLNRMVLKMEWPTFYRLQTVLLRRRKIAHLWKKVY
jgi:U3 small nucleolar RNA-associated protein 18